MFRNIKKMKLGDFIERITYYTGIKWLWKKLYPDCKCKERQEQLNDIELWQKIKLSGMVLNKEQHQ